MDVDKRRIKTSEIPIVKRELLQRQSGKCPLCNNLISLAEACLDHDHSSGLIREVLCRNCNGIEGKIRHLVTRARRGAAHKDYLGRMILYWIKHETYNVGLYHPLHKTADEIRLRTNKRARVKRAATKLVNK